MLAQSIAVLGPRNPIAFIHHTRIWGVVVGQVAGGLAIDGLAAADALDVIAKAEALSVHGGGNQLVLAIVQEAFLLACCALGQGVALCIVAVGGGHAVGGLAEQAVVGVVHRHGGCAIHGLADDVAHGIQLIGGDAAGGSLLDESPGVVIVPRRHADLSLCIGVFPSQPLARGIQRIVILRQQQVALAVANRGEMLKSVPSQFKDQRICFVAFQQILIGGTI